MPKNCQPIMVDYSRGSIAVAHNGNLVNAPALREELLSRGFGLTATSDSEVMTLMLAAAGGQTWEERIERTLPAWKGAFSLVLLAADHVIAVRDPFGWRPLSLGRVDGAWVIASETCAFDLLGAEHVRDLERGEMIVVDVAGVHSFKPFPPERRAHCFFEWIYFANVASTIDGRSVYLARKALGTELARLERQPRQGEDEKQRHHYLAKPARARLGHAADRRDAAGRHGRHLPAEADGQLPASQEAVARPGRRARGPQVHRVRKRRGEIKLTSTQYQVPSTK